ncbi:ATP-binding protein [Desertifilum tharense IPPAS B-1220]|uniref:Circadian input-output histidine kinase CikA n=1 Tax=Desertifilum tharense IPPAS B-1220 TaxID=1781255 RepID=A0A1E5QQM5_9CYAN|nr:ATP-binding protein [Desertifilum tharense]OEJ76969.1 histidine kinase [Desertifilum tharense IPPAS B-1220]
MTEHHQAVEQLFAGNSEMARRMRSLDWSQTRLGSIETWPQSLRSALSICLNSRFPIAIYWGTDFLLLYNDAWRPIVGDKHPWALGRPGREVWSEIWDDIGPELAEVLATGEGTFHHDELLAMHRFGYTEECFFEYTFNPIQGEGGRVDGVFNIVTETTYRVLNDRRARLLRELASKTGSAKTAEEACALMVEMLKSDPADIPLALLYLMEPDGKTVRLCGSIHVDVDRAIAPEAIALTTEITDPWSIAQVAQTSQPQTIANLVERFGILPGSPWPEPPQEAIVLPISATGQGKVTGVLVAVASPRRRLNDNYCNFFNQVAGQIAMAIANARSYEQERQRAEQLAELDRAKTVFFSNVSHEFRTPVTLMLSPLEEALASVEQWERASSPLEAIPPSTLKEQLQLIQRNGLRLLKLVNTLLDFSRIEAGRVQASYEPTDLAAFTADLASVFRSAIERANLRLIVNCPPLPEAVYVDREMWEKIVLNLLSNAFKFTFAGEIAVSLQWANDRVHLTVQDTGIGIPSAELPHLFERFHRVEGAQGRSIEGSGIGLSLVQELTKLHQGTIHVSSIEGAGTCFTVSIPTGIAHLPPERMSANRTLASTALGANSYLEEALRWLPENDSELALSRELTPQSAIQTTTYSPQERSANNPQMPRIVLADDNADMRDYVRRLLNQQYAVEAVSDGVAALSAIRRQVPDLVLTDVMMPNLDGFGLLQAIRSDPQTREVPIIMLSARAGEEAQIEGLEAGADDYLIKPFSARELLVRVEAMLKLAQLRREAAQTLQRSEERYRAFVQQSSEGIWRFEVEPPLSIGDSEEEQIQHLYQYAYLAECNQLVAQMYGVASVGDLIGMRLIDFLLPSNPRNLEYLRAFIRADYRLADAESYEVDCQGNPKIFLNNLIGIVEDGKLVRAWGTQRDITDRKRTELNAQFLNQLDRRLRQLSSAKAMAGEAIAMLGEHLNVDRCQWDRIYWSQGVVMVEQDWCKQDLPSLVGIYQISDMMLPDLVDLFRQGQLAVAADVTTYPHTAPFADNLLSLGIHAFIAVPCVYEGNWVATLAAHSKTTRNWQADEVALLKEFVTRLWSLIEHTRAIDELHQSEAELRHLANAMPQIVWISRADGFLEFINDRWIEYTGLDLEQSRDRTLMERMIPLEDSQQLQADFAQALETRSSYQSQFRFIQPDGSYRYFLARATPIKDEYGQIRKWYGTSTDITELKQLEAERTRLLIQEKAAREEAERANRIKDEFLAVLSHELRSPLNPILGWAKLLQSGRLDEARTKQALATIERNAKLQSELIEDLLDVSRILQGKLSLTSHSVNLASTISAAIETVRLAAEAKSIEIETRLEPEVGLVLGDATRLQQGVWNLLSNAVKFTPNGGRVTVRLEQVDTQAQIVVSDTGRGISPDFLPHVFDYFRQADSATTRRFGGLGLGLAIVRHLVELHGGTIQADSAGEGLGATFTLRLPLISAPPKVNQDAQLWRQSLNLNGVQILIVDDETDTRDFITFALEQAGATVTAVSSASEAIAALSHSQPNILVSDIGMPDIDGYMLMRQIRALPPEQGGQVQAIALTAYAGESDAQQAMAVGFQQHIAKPVEPEVLIRTIVTLLEQKD